MLLLLLLVLLVLLLILLCDYCVHVCECLLQLSFQASAAAASLDPLAARVQAAATGGPAAAAARALLKPDNLNGWDKQQLSELETQLRSARIDCAPELAMLERRTAALAWAGE